MHTKRRWLFYSFFLLSSFSLWGQDIDKGSQYISPEDVGTTLQKIAVSPVYDNTNNVYAKTLQKKLTELVDEDHRFELGGEIRTEQTPDQLDADPARVRTELSAIPADAMLTLKSIRTPNGMTLTLRLYRASDGKLFLQKVKDGIRQTHVKALNMELESVYRSLFADLPYQGLILSRKGTVVTINLGTRDGLSVGDEISAIQLVGFKRHPRFHFIISSQKQLIGTLKISKADDRLSFAQILTERAGGAVSVGTKVEKKKFVRYSQVEKALNNIPEVFGSDAREWVPEKPPSFGRVSAGFGLGHYVGALNGTYTNTTFNTTESHNIGTVSTFIPSIALEGELWLNPKWLVRLGLGQGIIDTVTDAGKQNISTSKYSFHVGYNFLLTNSFFGPKMGTSLSFLNYTYSVDDTGVSGLTSLRFDGWGLGVNGEFPLLKKNNRWTLGGEFKFYISSKLKETPRTSGSPKDIRITSFNLFLGYKISERVRLRGILDFELYSAKFSGTGERFLGTAPIAGESTSNRYNTLSLNLNYYF